MICRGEELADGPRPRCVKALEQSFDNHVETFLGTEVEGRPHRVRVIRHRTSTCLPTGRQSVLALAPGDRQQGHAWPDPDARNNRLTARNSRQEAVERPSYHSSSAAWSGVIAPLPAPSDRRRDR
jgi:hypothetical protein